MNIPEVIATCPKCNTDMRIEIPEETFVNINTNKEYPNVHANIKPIGTISVYRITSDDIKVFLGEKARFYIPETKVEVVPKFSEKKHRDGSKRSYAALQIAFSENVIKKQSGDGFFTKIGDDPTNVHFVDAIWVEMVKQYKFDRKEIEAWLGSYKKLEELEDRFGINEKFLEDLRLYATPRRFPTNNKENWIIFTAKADMVISDMLSSVITHKLEGNLEIHTINSINQNLIEFIVHVHPKDSKLKENPFIRKLLEEQK